MEEKVEEALNALLEKIEQDVAIKEYKESEKIVKELPDLTNLIEEIKAHNKEIVRFGHYGLGNAKERALTLSNEKTRRFDELVLVKDYRATLFEANELLQYVTKELTKSINEHLEKGE